MQALKRTQDTAFLICFVVRSELWYNLPPCHGPPHWLVPASLDPLCTLIVGQPWPREGGLPPVHKGAAWRKMQVDGRFGWVR